MQSMIRRPATERKWASPTVARGLGGVTPIYMKLRLQKLIANAGVTSRRKAEELIAAGKVTVNGIVVTELGAKAKLSDKITVNGKPLKGKPNKKTYIILNKPEGVVTTVTDPFGRPTVMDYIEEFTKEEIRLYPVGRLDFETSGLIIMTNDGDFTNTLTHPKYQIAKTYIAIVKGVPTANKLNEFAKGLLIEGQKTAPCEVNILPTSKGKQKVNRETKLSITIREGRNRQVRKMCEAIGHDVINLKRVSIGALKLENLPSGKWRYLTPREVKECQRKS